MDPSPTLLPPSDSMRILVTGHRPQKLGGFGPSPVQASVRAWLREQLLRAQSPAWTLTALSGMALGVDQWFAEEALALGLPLWAFVPFEGQENLWPAASQTHYRTLLARAAHRTIVSTGGYAPHKMQRRNEAMVDQAVLCLAVWDGSPGGTANCVAYATHRRVPIRRLNPLTLEVTDG